MVQPQPTQTCLCGRTMNFPDGEIKTVCQCSRVWEISTEGIWFTNLMFPFCQGECSRQTIVPKVARVRNKRKRKAGSRC